VRSLSAVKPVPSSSKRASRGFSLIDVLLVIVLLGIVATGLATVSGRLAAQSALSLKTRQAMTLAQGLLEEVRHAPFTYCDGVDELAPNVTGAFPGPGGCPTQVDLMGPEPGESRYVAGSRFDGVTDYRGFTMPGPGCAGLCDMAGNVVNVVNGGTSSLVGCSAGVTMAPVALAAIPALDANGRPQVLRIAVTVACPGLDPLVVETVRVRHAPITF
jgi:MSHA pilin protein MshD